MPGPTPRRAIVVLWSIPLICGLAACAVSGSAVRTTTSGITSSPATTSPATTTSIPTAPAQVSVGPGSPDSATTSSATVPPTATKPAVVVVPPVQVRANPAFGAMDISPSAPISVAVDHGVLTGVTMTNHDGKTIKAALAADGKSWKVGEDLGFGKQYQVQGTARGADGKIVTFSGTFSTVTPQDEISTTISPGDGAVVGVAEPVIVEFGGRPADPKAAEKSVKITTTPVVKGAWAWIQHDGDKFPSLDWRPENYWPAGTEVHVESDIYGVDFGPGNYGAADVTNDFTIGRNQVVIADAHTHMMTVQRDGKTTAAYPASLGMGDDPNGEFGLDQQFVSRSGIHVVMDKHETVSMSNGQYYQNAVEHWAVRISDNGEYVHANPYTVDQQGVRNVTHGCVNLSPTNAEAYYNTALEGDPVEITGTSVQLSAADGDLYDWAVPWNAWLAMG